jgi:hypothetical protein
MPRPPYSSESTANPLMPSESAFTRLLPPAGGPPPDYPEAGDKGGSKMGGGLGAGVEAPDNPDVGAAGYKCEATFPLTGEFWTRDPEHGQA